MPLWSWKPVPIDTSNAAWTSSNLSGITSNYHLNPHFKEAMIVRIKNTRHTPTNTRSTTHSAKGETNRNIVSIHRYKRRERKRNLVVHSHHHSPITLFTTLYFSALYVFTDTLVKVSSVHLSFLHNGRKCAGQHRPCNTEFPFVYLRSRKYRKYLQLWKCRQPERHLNKNARIS